MWWVSPPGAGVAGGGVVGVLKGVSTESELISPLELMAATNTLYSALGINPLNLMLVSFVYTVALVPFLSWYLTL